MIELSNPNQWIAFRTNSWLMRAIASAPSGFKRECQNCLGMKTRRIVQRPRAILGLY
jgi:hypothetical protein